MVDNRISLRLDNNEIQELEMFLSTHREFASRSHLAREAIRKFISEGKGWKDSSRTEDQVARARIFTVALPFREAEVIEDLVSEGYFFDVSDGIRRLVSRFVTDRNENMEKSVDSILEQKRKMVQMDSEK